MAPRPSASSLRTSAALAALLVSAPALAVTFEVPVQGSQELTLAVAEPVATSSAAGLGARVADVVRRDLDLTGYFDLVDPAAQIDRSAGVEPGTFTFSDWTALRASALAKLRVLPAGDRSCDPAGQKACVDVYIYDVNGGELLAKKRVRAAPDQPVTIGHAVADEILFALVGERGPFQGVLAAVGEQSGNKEIYVLGLGGEAPRPVTRNGSINLSPAWGPSGSSLAWTSYKAGNPDLYVKDLRTGAVRTLSALPGVNISPAFSPDGKLVALARSEGADTDLVLIDAATGTLVRKLTSGGGIDVGPSFSPDGTRVIFSSERSGGSSIYEVPVTGGEPRRVTPFAGFFTDPVYSPDGTRVAFVSRKGGFDVLVCNTDGSGLVRITQDQGDNEDPTWSPDGRYLAFSSTRGGRKRLWVSTANGRHQVPITESAGWSQPTWLP